MLKRAPFYQYQSEELKVAMDKMRKISLHIGFFLGWPYRRKTSAKMAQFRD